MSKTQISLIKILIVLIISGSMLFIPFESLGVPINPIQARVVSLFVLAALMWILEPIPIWTTSVLVIMLSLLCVSNQAFKFLKPARYDVNAVNAIVCQAVGTDAASPAMQKSVVTHDKEGKEVLLTPLDALQKDLKSRLDKKATLNAEEI